jgi:hypothetical protein
MIMSPKNMMFFIIMMAALMGGCLQCVFADYYAAQNGQTPAAPYTSWASAAANIQDAVNAAADNATVWIGAGRYTVPPNATNYVGGSNVVFVNRPLALRGSNGIPESVFIDGEGVNRGLAVAYSTMGYITIDGITFTNGYNYSTGTDEGYGGGLYILPGAAFTSVMQNCVFANNATAGNGGDFKSQGGGLWIQASGFIVVSNCIFRGNRAVGQFGGGGGAYMYTGGSGGGLILNSLFEKNAAAVGGGLNFRLSGTRGFDMTNCIVRNNSAIKAAGSAAYGGGGVHHWPATLRMWNCLVYDNYTDNYGGGIYTQKAPGGLELYNCTVVSNRAPAGAGGGLHTRQTADHIYMYNSIVCSNSPANMQIGLYGTSTSLFAYSCFTNLGGTGPYEIIGEHVESSPAFVDFSGDDFRLSSLSPCVNAGTNQEWMINSADLEGKSRIDKFSGRVDMGCYEYLPRGMLFHVR